MKIREVINKIEGLLPEWNNPRICDVVHFGDTNKEVMKVATCFMADIEVIKKAADAGVNFIITHEPTWYAGSGTDPAWLLGNPVYEEKVKLLKEADITIWRCHDLMHAHTHDLIYAGIKRELGWENNIVDSFFPHHKIEITSLAQLCDFFKEKLNVPTVRVIGNPEMPVQDVGVLIGGSSLGLGDDRMPTRFMTEENLDVIVCGEINECTLCSFVRDAVMLGMNKAMIILGHNRTEEAGMKYFAEVLGELLPEVETVFIPSGEPVEYL